MIISHKLLPRILLRKQNHHRLPYFRSHKRKHASLKWQTSGRSALDQWHRRAYRVYCYWTSNIKHTEKTSYTWQVFWFRGSNNARYSTNIRCLLCFFPSYSVWSLGTNDMTDWQQITLLGHNQEFFFILFFFLCTH